MHTDNVVRLPPSNDVLPGVFTKDTAILETSKDMAWDSVL